MDLTPLGPDNVAVAEPATEVARQTTNTEVSAQTAARDSGQRVLEPGYKQTEMGMIPEDWNVAKLGEKAYFRTGPFGSALHKSDYTVDGIPLINPMHILDGKLAPSRAMTITEEAARQLSEYRLRGGDIVIGRRGEMGRCAVVQESQVGWLCGTGSLIIRCTEGVAPDYLQRVLSSADVVSAIEDASVGSTMINLNQGVLSGLSIQFPPLPEQRAIAAALSDVDALLAKLDALIAKKRDVKQAAMQQLLSGKQRLPGFSGEWEVKRLGDLFQFLSTANNARSDLSEYGDVGYIHYGDIHTGTSSFLDCTAREMPHIAQAKVKNTPLLEDGDLVMADASEDYEGIGKSVEVLNVGGRKIVAGLHTFLLRGNRELIVNGFKGYLQHIPTVRTALVKLATGISVYGVSKSNVKSIEVLLPCAEEQTAIAAVLSDMDAELAALEARRDKTRALKQGMMQELLTGRIRLL